MFAKFVESYSFFKIVLSPLIIGTVVGFSLYHYFDRNPTGTFLFGICILSGLISGIIWAAQITRTYGAHHFVSRVDASEDITEAVKRKNKETQLPANSEKDTSQDREKT